MGGGGGEGGLLNQLYTSFIFEISNEIWHVISLANEVYNSYKTLAIYRNSDVI